MGSLGFPSVKSTTIRSLPGRRLAESNIFTRTKSRAPAVFVDPPTATKLEILVVINPVLVEIGSVTSEKSIIVWKAGSLISVPANSTNPIRVSLPDKVVLVMKLLTK